MELPLVEKWRPRCWRDVVGQDEVVARLQGLARRGWIGGRAYWISGKSGTGKTTIARLIAAEIADEFFVTELDAGALTVSELQELERSMASYAWGEGKNGRAYLINEAHGLRKPVVRQLLVLLERLPAHVAIVFCTTSTGLRSFEEGHEDARPLLSRCFRVELKEEGLARCFAERCRMIAQANGLDGQPFDKYLALARKHGNNLRAMLQSVELGEMCHEQPEAWADGECP